MKIFINACNIHIGGGKVLLDDLIKSFDQRNKNSYFFIIDKRYKNPKLDTKTNFKILKINRFFRFFIDFYLLFNIQKKDKLIIFTNLPPLFKFNNNITLILSSKFYIDKYSLKDTQLIIRLQMFFQKIFFNIFIKNISKLIVPTLSMYNLAKIKIDINKISIFPFKFNDLKSNEYNNGKKNHFIYVASGQEYKNHLNLFKCWKHLENENINLKLVVTLSNKEFKNITNKSNYSGKNIINYSNISRNELIKLYFLSKALIYPSFFESYALPLVEANIIKLPIIASELDYVRDIVDPDETFNPHSSISMYRSIRRFLDIPEDKVKINTPYDFINNYIDEKY